MAFKTYTKTERNTGKSLKAAVGIRSVYHKYSAQRPRWRVAELGSEGQQDRIACNTSETPIINQNSIFI